MTTRHIIHLITLPAESVVMSAADYEYLEAMLNTNKQLEQELRLAEEGLASYAQENEQLCGDLSLAKRALEDLAQANGRFRAALEKIMDYDPGQFRPLEDETAIWRLATEALGPLTSTTGST